MLDRIDDCQQQINAFRPFESDLLPVLRNYYRIGLSYSSTAIEGFSYTESETKVLLEEGLTVGGRPLRDALAVTGHAKAYDYMFDLLHEKHLKNKDILTMHTLLEGGLESGTAGEYRKTQIFVTGSDHAFPKPERVPALMSAFEDWMTNTRGQLHPVAFAVQLHLNLISVHPFEDGNGRIARLAMNAVLLQEGFLPLVIPPLLRSEYIDCIKEVQTTKRDSGYLQFMYRRELETQKEMLRLLQGSNA